MMQSIRSPPTSFSPRRLNTSDNKSKMNSGNDIEHFMAQPQSKEHRDSSANNAVKSNRRDLAIDVNDDRANLQPTLRNRAPSYDSILDNGCSSPTAWLCEKSHVIFGGSRNMDHHDNDTNRFHKKTPTLDATILTDTADSSAYKSPRSSWQRSNLSNSNGAHHARAGANGKVLPPDSSSDDEDDIISKTTSIRRRVAAASAIAAAGGNKSTKPPPPPSKPSAFTIFKEGLLQVAAGAGVSASSAGGGARVSDGSNSVISTLSVTQRTDHSITSEATTHAPGGGVANSSRTATGRLIQTTVEGEPRIVAPNVEKLSPTSVIEVRLRSQGECVAVLCSVDVLKMRSGYFHDLLEEQEHEQDRDHSAIMNGSIWRQPIVIEETSPFEAAAFLESLHEGRSLFKGEWNYAWARLSVQWHVDDLTLEYASQIDSHSQKVLSAIQANHWRTNPNVFAGMRVAIFRKNAAPIPCIVTGTVVESGSIGYSRLRVAFDMDKVNVGILPAALANNGAASMGSPFPHPQQNNMISSYGLPSGNQSANSANSFVGEISEPFWIQHSHFDPPVWSEPDDVFLQDAKKIVSAQDKRVFWEMIQAVIELPQLSANSSSPIKSPRDIAAVLKRVENRYLWINDGPQCLPAQVAAELISAAYVTPQNGEKKD